MELFISMVLNFCRYKTFVVFKSVTFENVQILLASNLTLSMIFKNISKVLLLKTTKVLYLQKFRTNVT